MILPNYLSAGDEIRVIAPSRSLAIIKAENISIAQSRLEKLGFKVTYGKHTSTHDEFFSSSVEDRIADIIDALTDKNVKAIFTAIGGFNANQLLKEFPFDLVAEHPKIWLGYSDITALTLSIHAKTGLVTYSGPHFSSFGMKYGFDYTMEYFKKAIMSPLPFEIHAAETWSDDPWYMDQEMRTYHPQNGFRIVQEGCAEGKLLCGNLSTWNLLQGTEWMPDLSNSILVVEDDFESHPSIFDRMLTSLLHQPNANLIRGLVVGRFQEASQMTNYALDIILKSKKELANLPIIADFHYSHTFPLATLPIGRQLSLKAKENKVDLYIK